MLITTVNISMINHDKIPFQKFPCS